MHTYKSLNRLCLCRRHHHRSLLRFSFSHSRCFFFCFCCSVSVFYIIFILLGVCFFFHSCCVIKMRFSVQIVQCSNKMVASMNETAKNIQSWFGIVVWRTRKKNTHSIHFYNIYKAKMKMTQILLTMERREKKKQSVICLSHSLRVLGSARLPSQRLIFTITPSLAYIIWCGLLPAPHVPFFFPFRSSSINQ